MCLSGVSVRVVCVHVSVYWAMMLNYFPWHVFNQNAFHDGFYTWTELSESVHVCHQIIQMYTVLESVAVCYPHNTFSFCVYCSVCTRGCWFWLHHHFHWQLHYHRSRAKCQHWWVTKSHQCFCPAAFLLLKFSERNVRYPVQPCRSEIPLGAQILLVMWLSCSSAVISVSNWSS